VIRTTRQIVEVLGAGDGKARVTRQITEVLQSVASYVGVIDALSLSDAADAILEVTIYSANDTFSQSDEAVREFVAERGVTDSLALSDEAIGAKLYVVSSSDTLAMSDEAISEIIHLAIDTLVLSDLATAETVRSVVDTLSLSDDVVVELILNRGVVDTLTLGETANCETVFTRKKIDYLSLDDIVTGERIKLASDTLVLTDYASVDRILVAADTLSLGVIIGLEAVYGRSITDTLSLGEIVTGNKEILRDASDTLVLGESNVGDYCRVVTETLVLSDEAIFIYVKPVYDTLSLSDEASCAGSVYNRKKIDYLSMTDSAAGWREKIGDVTDILSLTDRATLILWVNDALSLADVADANYSRVAHDTLTLGDSAEVTTNHMSSHDELLSLSDLAAVDCVYARNAHDQITTLHDHAWPGFYRLIASDILQIEYVEYGPAPDYTPIITYTGLQDQAIASIIHYAPKTVEDHLSFAEHVLGIKIRADAIPVDATDALSLLDGAFASKVAGVQDSLTLSDAAEVVASKLLIDELELSDAASFNINRNSLSANDTLELGESVLWYNRLEDNLWVYHPFVGEGPGTNPEPPDEDLEGPIPGITDPFKLVYPTIGPFTDTLVLRAPNFGNRDRLQMNRISRETRGGTLVVYADPIWPKIQTLVMSFSGLTWAQANGLHTFIDNHLGLEVGMLDYEHRFWRGIVTKFDDPIVQDGKGCKYTVNFEFEGELAAYSP
jgi:hypothetical protein